MCLAQVRIQPRRLWDVVSPAHSVSPSESNSCRRVWNQGRRLPHHRLPWTVHRSGSPADQHIFLPFFGGPDDRLTLSLVVQLCAGDSGVTATVVRVRKTGGAEVVYSTEEAKTTVHNVRVSRLEWNGMLIHNRFFQTVFPDTVCGHQSTQTRLASDTADDLIWGRYTSSKIADTTIREAIGRIASSEERTNKLLKYVHFTLLLRPLPFTVVYSHCIFPYLSDDLFHYPKSLSFFLY